MSHKDEVVHLKTGKTYRMLGKVVDATNSRDGEELILYQNEDGGLFVREVQEFWVKFARKEPSCCVCGSTENLHYDGPFFGYRCGSPNCLVF